MAFGSGLHLGIHTKRVRTKEHNETVEDPINIVSKVKMSERGRSHELRDIPDASDSRLQTPLLLLHHASRSSPVAVLVDHGHAVDAR